MSDFAEDAGGLWQMYSSLLLKAPLQIGAWTEEEGGGGGEKEVMGQKTKRCCTNAMLGGSRPRPVPLGCAALRCGGVDWTIRLRCDRVVLARAAATVLLPSSSLQRPSTSTLAPANAAAASHSCCRVWRRQLLCTSVSSTSEPADPLRPINSIRQ